MLASVQQQAAPPLEPLPASSDNSGGSSSNGGAADSGRSDFVVAGSPVQELESVHDSPHDAVPLTADLSQAGVLQVGQQQELSVS